MGLMLEHYDLIWMIDTIGMSLFVARLVGSWIFGDGFLEHKIIYITDPGITGDASLDVSVICVQQRGAIFG